jgi:hypothetical protein
VSGPRRPARPQPARRAPRARSRPPRWVRCGSAGLLAALLLCAGCLRLPPHLVYRVEVAPEPALLAQGPYYLDPADSTTVFERAGFRLKVRYLSDTALNQEYAKDTFREPNLNPFTYGTDRDLDLGYAPPRFTVLRLTVVNQAYPKVLVDPAQMVLETDRGVRLGYWDVSQREAANSFEAYYMQRRGKGGNEDYYYQQRLGLVREALYRRQTYVYQGESYTGKVVFAALHPQVRQIVLRVPGIVLRVDAFDRPTETVEAVFRFTIEQSVVTASPTPRAAQTDSLPTP